LTFSIKNQTISLCIDARLSGDVTLCASRKICIKNKIRKVM